ncbi:T9SS type A sorting domain-containing protein [bacterium]|nr:T9SS type A sorting domain-containing protein [bacterium]
MKLISFAIVILIATFFVMSGTADATPYVPIEELQQQLENRIDNGTNEVPPLHPGELDEYNYVYEYLQVLDWMTTMQVTEPGEHFGGQREGEQDLDIIETDNTQEAIRDWSRYGNYTGDLDRFHQNIMDAWEYTMNHPAYDEEGGGNPNYYRVHNCGWGLVATMEYTEAYDDEQFLWYGDSCAVYLDTYRLQYGNEFSVNPISSAYGAGALYLYGSWRGNQEMMDAAQEIATEVKDWIENNPDHLTDETWAMSGGTAMWGVVTAQFSDDHEAGQAWLPDYIDIMDVYAGAGNWNNSQTIWYGHAWNAIHEVMEDQESADNALWTVDFLLDQDEIDGDGGVPATEGMYENDQSWTSAYLVWYGIEKLLPEEPLLQDAMASSFVSPGENFPILHGVEQYFAVRVINAGLADLTGITSIVTIGDFTAEATFDLAANRDTVVTLQPAFTYRDVGDVIVTHTVTHAEDMNPDNNSYTHTFSGQFPAIMSGRVFDETTDEGVPAVLELWNEELQPEGPAYTINTDDQGNYEIYFAAGRYDLPIIPQIAPYNPVNWEIIFEEGANQEFNYPVRPAEVLFVSEIPDRHHETFILDALDEIEVDAYYWNVEEMGQPHPYFEPVQTVLWATGNADEGIFIEENHQPLETFLLNGGSVLMTGQGLLNVEDNATVYGGLFGVAATDMDFRPQFVRGSDHPITNRDSLLLFGAGGANNQTTSDALDYLEDALPVLNYSNNDQAAAVAYISPDTDARTLFCGFGVEAINSSAQAFMSRSEFLANTLAWFWGTEVGGASPETLLPAKFTVQTWPNPFNPNLNIEVSVPVKSPLTISIYNMLGQNVQEWNEANVTPGKYMYQWNANAASGFYLVNIHSNERDISKRVLLVK